MNMSDLSEQAILDAIDEALKVVSPVWEERLKKTHRQGTTPEGVPWKPRKHPRPNPLLIDSGKLLNAYRSKYRNYTTEIENTAPYSAYHDKGTRHLDRRPLLPEEMPEEWLQEFDDALQAELDKL